MSTINNLISIRLTMRSSVPKKSPYRYRLDGIRSKSNGLSFRNGTSNFREQDELVNNLAEALATCDKGMQDVIIECSTKAAEADGKRVKVGIDKKMA